MCWAYCHSSGQLQPLLSSTLREQNSGLASNPSLPVSYEVGDLSFVYSRSEAVGVYTGSLRTGSGDILFDSPRPLNAAASILRNTQPPATSSLPPGIEHQLSASDHQLGQYPPIMKTSHASLAVFSGLAAVVTADALPPEDIPVQCATICGPVVELTSACNVHQMRLLKRRRVDDRMWVPKLGVEPKVGAVRDDDRVEKREFSVIVQAPTSFPPDVVSPTTLDSRPTSRPTKVHPVIVDSSSTNPPSPSSPPAATTAPGDSTPVPLPSTTASLQDGTTAGDLAEQKGWAAPEGAEEQCVCLNDSFDVGSVTALCASCITQAGDVENSLSSLPWPA